MSSERRAPDRQSDGASAQHDPTLSTQLTEPGQNTDSHLTMPGPAELVSRWKPIGGADLAKLITVLLIEDDTGIRTSLAAALRAEGYSVVERDDGAGLDQDLVEVDLAIVDVGLPRGPDGLALARHLTQRRGVPVIVLTAADGHSFKEAGYRAGIDLYVTKPFDLSELLWMVQALLRRTGRTETLLRAGDIEIDLAGKLVRFRDQPLRLTPTEFAVLEVLARHRGQVLSKQQLLDLAWGHSGYDPNLVETTVRRLRAKLAPHGAETIRTVRGFGYELAT